MRPILVPPDHPLRAATEHMVRDAYAARYGASLGALPPLLAAVLDATGAPACAAGLRDAESGFFSECYLEVPVESRLASLARCPVARDSVLEVTSLAARSPGLTATLVGFVLTHGRDAGKRWGIFTATATLRRALARRGIVASLLAPADASRVPDPERWGSYYACDPWVCVVGADAAEVSSSRPRLPEVPEVA
ncbi:MAG: thermostable hemolysin [Ectothiorhodospiraceae bacterium]|nr:thermostable hemolysin [Ectothiorhodospiraceae bacterium]